jgi:hypothetical protein
MEHKLFNQLVAADATDEEMAELYEDLRYVFGDPFDELIEEAVSKRGCVYVESCQTFPI